MTASTGSGSGTLGLNLTSKGTPRTRSRIRPGTSSRTPSRSRVPPTRSTAPRRPRRRSPAAPAGRQPGQRQLQLHRHRARRQLPLQARFGQLRRLHQPDSLLGPRRRQPHLLGHRQGRGRQHQRRRHTHLVGGRDRPARTADPRAEQQQPLDRRDLHLDHPDRRAGRHLPVQPGRHRQRPLHGLHEPEDLHAAHPGHARVQGSGGGRGSATSAPSTPGRGRSTASQAAACPSRSAATRAAPSIRAARPRTWTCR